MLFFSLPFWCHFAGRIGSFSLCPFYHETADSKLCPHHHSCLCSISWTCLPLLFSLCVCMHACVPARTCVPSHLHPAPLSEDTVLELDQNPHKLCQELSRLPLPLEEFISPDKVLSGFSGTAGDRPCTQQHVTPASCIHAGSRQSCHTVRTS